MSFIVELPPEFPKSEQPRGGTPETDRAYLVWRSRFLEQASEGYWASRWHVAADRVPRLEPWRLDAYLYDALGGPCPLLPGDRTNYSHRLRFLGIALRDHRARLLRAAQTFVSEVTLCDVR